MSYHINGCCGNEKKNDKYNFINFFLFTNWTSLTISVMKYYFSTFALSVFMSSLNKMLLPATKIQRKLLLDLRIQLFLLPKLLGPTILLLILWENNYHYYYYSLLYSSLSPHIQTPFTHYYSYPIMSCQMAILNKIFRMEYPKR